LLALKRHGLVGCDNFETEGLGQYVANDGISRA
jgi:hypothetical protein